ncbi:unnamed protein product [Allacma fusca]|uniref:Protein phosphatase 1 regulatory subunit 16A n=1 Tax=Allacma fusca TaxID=39272 RepID=A0A8J2KAS7_9HEXA|nr:unnamed protein product [Allacma fusca]
MDHEDLIQELPSIERLTNQERLKLAHRRRLAQLKKYQQYEKDLGSKKNKMLQNEQHKRARNKNGPRVKFRNSIMLLEAAGRNDVEEVRELLAAGVDPDVANEDGLTALHQCCIDDNEEMLKLLLEFGANVNAEDSERWTPLHAASTCGHLHLVKLLIASGANLLSVNAEGNMPYDICDEEATLDYIESEMAKRGVTQELIEEIRALPETIMLEDMKILSQNNGDLEFRDPDGATPLHIAAANGYLRVVEFLLDNHVSTEVVCKDNWQPIHAAACWGHIDVLELLVQNGADLNARTKNNETPYAICEDPEIKERIIQLRSEQETKAQDAARRKIRRSQSSNSRTQSIRRTSHRDKGLTSKKDAADEAQMLMAREINIKESSPSPTTEIGLTSPPVTANVNETHPDHHAEDEPEDKSSLPPSIFHGKDSVSQIKVSPHEMDRLRDIASQSGVLTHSNNVHNKSNINYNNNKLHGKFHNPIAVPAVMDSNENLPKHDNVAIPTPVETNANVQVKVTINTSNSPTSTINGGNGGNMINGGTMISSSPSLPMILNNAYTAPGTLADLKKQRSLQYLNRNHTLSLNVDRMELKFREGYTYYYLKDIGLADLPSKYEIPPSPSMSLRRFAGDPGDIVGDYSDAGKKCCSIV